MKKNINFNIVLFLLIANIVFLFGCNYNEENNFLVAPYARVLAISPIDDSKFNLNLNTITITFSDDIVNANNITNYYLSGSALGTLTISGISNFQNSYTLSLIGQPSISGDLTISVSNVANGYGTILTNAVFTYHVWWDYSWKTRKKILIDNSGQSEDLVNFPVLIHLNSSNIDYTKTQNNGEDIRFVDNNWNQLSHEIEQWDENGSSFIWVNVPLIYGSSATNSIYMYYNNPTVADNQNSSEVWNSSYETVLHLNQTTGTQFDSTANNNNGTNEGTITSSTGQIGNSCDFDAGTDRIVINANISATVTISAWAKLDTQDSMLWCVNAANQGPDLWFNDDRIFLNTWNGFDNPFGSQPVNVDQWHYYSTVIKDGDTQLFIDGVSNSSAGYEGPTSTIIYIGSYLSTYNWDGSIDEFRVSNIRQSADWIKAQYLSMSLTNGFISYGAEEE